MMAEGGAQAELLAVVQYDYQQLADYLRSKGTRTETAKLFEDNLIDGEAFFSLSRRI